MRTFTFIAILAASVAISACSSAPTINGGTAVLPVTASLPFHDVAVQSVGAMHPSHAVHWIVSEAGIQILASKMSMSEIHGKLDTPKTYEIMNLRSHADPLPHATHLLYFRDETQIAPALRSGTFKGIDGALYDDEAYAEPGNTTPDAQKLDPVPYARDAARTLHAAGKQFVYTIGPSTGNPALFWTNTLPAVAAYPDVIDFQTQSAEGTPNFAREVAHYSQIFRSVGRGKMIVGIGAAPQGKHETADDVISAFNDGMKNSPPVDGFWINLAPQSASCTGCPEVINPAPIVSLLRQL